MPIAGLRSIIQSIIYKVTRYNNIITNTMDYKYLNIINIAYFCALINQNNLPNRLALCPYTENLSIIKACKYARPTVNNNVNAKLHFI